ncbi:MAG: TetR/AcrR family transcriptional regulator [Bacteroidota bacterium]
MTKSSKILERREREKQEMHDKIVRAAREMFLEEGYEKVSIRKIADRISYSPGTIYNYFDSKDELLNVVHEQGFVELHRLLNETMVIEDPFARLQQMGQIYWNYAMENPEEYDLMFLIRAPMHAEENLDSWDCGFMTFEVLHQTVLDLQASGRMQEHDPNALTFLIWSSVHGMVSLVIRERLKMYPEEVQANIGQAGLATLLNILQAYDR